MSTVPKRPGLSNKVVYGLIGVAAVIMLLCTGIFLWMVAGSMSFGGGGQQLKSGNSIRPGGTFLKGDDASVLKPEVVIKAFLTELSQEQVEDAYERTSRGFRSSMSQSDFNAMVQKNKALIGHLSIRYKGVTKSNDGIQMYKGHVGGGPNGACDFTLKIAQDGDGWRITEFTVP